MAISYARTENDGRGGSRTVDVEVDQAEAIIEAGVPPVLVSAPIPAESVLFVEIPLEERASDWHPSPAHQFTVVLSGVAEIETSDGEVRRLGPGDVALAGDTDGLGHLSRVVEPPVRLLFVTLPSESNVVDSR